jgi:hypothetical protein
VGRTWYPNLPEGDIVFIGVCAYPNLPEGDIVFIGVSNLQSITILIFAIKHVLFDSNMRIARK